MPGIELNYIRLKVAAVVGGVHFIAWVVEALVDFK